MVEAQDSGDRWRTIRRLYVADPSKEHNDAREAWGKYWLVVDI